MRLMIQEPQEVNAVQDNEDARSSHSNGSEDDESCDESLSSSEKDEVDELCDMIGTSLRRNLNCNLCT